MRPILQAVTFQLAAVRVHVTLEIRPFLQLGAAVDELLAGWSLGPDLVEDDPRRFLYPRMRAPSSTAQPVRRGA